nr:MAG TPA: hypothetical protein [Caudoviricetes sp.]
MFRTSTVSITSLTLSYSNRIELPGLDDSL